MRPPLVAGTGTTRLSPGPAVREALHSFTLRGRSFLAAGVTAMACGVVLGERDLVRIGALAALLHWSPRSGSHDRATAWGWPAPLRRRRSRWGSARWCTWS